MSQLVRMQECHNWYECKNVTIGTNARMSQLGKSARMSQLGKSVRMVYVA